MHTSSTNSPVRKPQATLHLLEAGRLTGCSQHRRRRRLDYATRRADEAVCEREDEPGRADPCRAPGPLRGRGGAGRGLHGERARADHQGVLFRRRAADAEPADPAGRFRQPGDIQDVRLYACPTSGQGSRADHGSQTPSTTRTASRARSRRRSCSTGRSP